MPRICFMARTKTRSGKLTKRKVRVCFTAKKHRKGRTPKRLAKFAAKVRAGKVRRNRRGQIIRFTR